MYSFSSKTTNPDLNYRKKVVPLQQEKWIWEAPAPTGTLKKICSICSGGAFLYLSKSNINSIEKLIEVCVWYTYAFVPEGQLSIICIKVSCRYWLSILHNKVLLLSDRICTLFMIIGIWDNYKDKWEKLNSKQVNYNQKLEKTWKCSSLVRQPHLFAD